MTDSNKRLLLACGLCLLIAFVFQQFFTPPPASPPTGARPRETQEEGIVRIIKKTPAGDKVIRDFQSTEKKVSAALSCTKCAQPIGGSDVTCPHCKILIVRRYCSSCKKLYPEHARGCPHCGASGEKRFRYYRHPEGYLTAGIALLIFSIAVAMNWAQPSEKPRPKAPSAIAQRLSANAHLQPRIYKVVPAKPRVESEHIEKTSEPPAVPAENIAIDPEVKETGSKPSIPSEEPEVEPAAPPTQQEPQSDESYDESFTEPESEPSSDETVEPDVPIETDESEDAPQSDEPARLQVNKRGRALNDLGYRLMRSGQPEHAIPILQERLKLGDQRQVVLAELEAAKRDLVSAEVQPSMQ